MIPRFLALFVVIPWISVSAAQLDIAILQFTELKSTDEINSALVGVSLAELTNGDRTNTKISALKGGQVLFAQSLTPTPNLRSYCRLSNNKVELDGGYNGGVLSLKITLSEELNIGLRRLSSRVFEGSAPLPLGSARVIAIRNIESKSRSYTRGIVEIKNEFTCNLIVSQIK